MGLACLVLSGAWWFAFFQNVGLATRVKVEGLARDVWPCLFYTTEPGSCGSLSTPAAGVKLGVLSARVSCLSVWK